MHDTARERAERIAWCKPEHQVYGASFQGIHFQGNQLAERHRDGAPWRSKYPAKTWNNDFRYPLADFLTLYFDTAELARTEAGPSGDPFAYLARELSNAFARTSTGQIAMRLIAGKNPIDLLASTPGVYRSRLAFGDRSFERHNSNSATLHVREDPMPPGYYVGTLLNTFSFNGYAPELEAKVLSITSGDYTVRWDGKPPPNPPRN
jgi:uncharacterized protein (TIGR02265 family)